MFASDSIDFNSPKIAELYEGGHLEEFLTTRGLSAAAVCFVVVMHIEEKTAAKFAAAIDADPDLQAVLADMRAILEQNGVSPKNPWPLGEGTPEFEALRSRGDQHINEIHAQTLLADVIRAGRLITLLKNAAPIFARECKAFEEKSWLS